MKNWDGTYISVQTIPVFLSANPASQMPKSVFLSKLSYEHPAKGTGFIIFIAFLLIVSLFGSCNNGDSRSSKPKSSTCPVCLRSFSDSANRRSIAYSGMCKKCKDNLDYGLAATGRSTAFFQFDENDQVDMVNLRYYEMID